MIPIDEPFWNDQPDGQDDQPFGKSGQSWDDDKGKDIPWSGQQDDDIPNLDQPSPWQQHGVDDIPNYLPNWITKPPIENSNPPPDEHTPA
jgi:hypothetical protein